MSRWAVALKNTPLILRGIYEYHIASRFGPLRPREWLFPVTYRCDARCIMCNIWQSSKGAELSLGEWSSILDDQLFAGVQSVDLTGGEPTLRRDLPQLAELLTAKLPALQRLTINTNALDTRRVVTQCAALLDLCTARDVRFFVGISLDGIGPLHDEMRNIPGAFDKVKNTVDELQRLQPHGLRPVQQATGLRPAQPTAGLRPARLTAGLRMGIHCTLTNRNLHGAEQVSQWSAERGLPVNYIIASFAESYYANTESADDLAFSAQQRAELVALLRKLGARKSPDNLAAYFYSDAARMIEQGSARTTPCVFQKDGFVLDGRGDLQYCMYSRVLGNARQANAAAIYYAPENLSHRQDIMADRCRNCTITCFLELALAKDALKYARFLLGGQK